MSAEQPQWEKDVLERLLFASLQEQRRARRWGIFFKLMFLFYVLIFILILWPNNTTEMPGVSTPHAAIINITGTIFPGGEYSAEHIIRNLNRAFQDKNTLGVILNINSPGGTPVQADEVYNEITRLRQRYPSKKIYAVCSDICASGAYYIAASTNAIYADPSSLVGSIGVMIGSFGFTDAMQKLGIERRLLVAGKNKGLLDPFSPMNDTQKHYLQDIIDKTHQIFIDKVKQGRGARLKLDTPDLFSGLVWTGADAERIGLVDGMKSVADVARDLFKTKNIVNYRSPVSFIDRLSRGLTTDFADGLLRHLS
ncbi:MAG: S49 family peptidase [Legionellales bacterium]|nr:S49 family peptidase [Legionellales bacterium]